MEDLAKIQKCVCENIKKYRLQKGLSIKELSNMSGVSEKYLTRIENNDVKKLILKKIVSIAYAMNIPVCDLFLC